MNRFCRWLCRRLNIICFEMGDVNMDGVVDKADADLVLEYVAETKQLTPGQLRLADMGGSGRVTAYDAALILQKAGLARVQ